MLRKPKASNKAQTTVKNALLVLGFKRTDIFNTQLSRTGKTVQTPLYMRHPKSIWDRDDLQYILVDAKRQYIHLSQIYHPDRPEGNPEKMRELNLAWEFVQKVFKRKGFSLN